MVRLCESFLGEGQELTKVVYFTASPLNPDKSSRQSAFLNANKLINGDRFEIVRGKYLEKHIICPYCKGDISRPEEKKTDVNISIRMIEDCLIGATDTIALVSADSDLVPPLELIQKRYPNIAIKVYFPPSNYSNDLKDNLLHHRSRPVEMKKNLPRFLNAIMQFGETVGFPYFLATASPPSRLPWLFYCPIHPDFHKIRVNTLLLAPPQPSKNHPASPCILPYPLLSRRIPSIPESDFCHPCTFAPSFKAQPTGAHVGHAKKTNKRKV